MRTIILTLIAITFSINIFGQNINGVYKGLIEMCDNDSLGIRHCYGDEANSDDKWFHLCYLKIDNDSVFLDMYPISINAKGDTLHSASDGGFFYYTGIITKTKDFRIDLIEVYCDYCGELVVKNDKGEYIPKKREKTITVILIKGGLMVDGQNFKLDDIKRHMESQFYKPEIKN